MSASAESLVEQALGYAQRGWRVVPLHTPAANCCSCASGGDCKNAGKHPRISQWPRRATTDEAQITAWWDSWPQANIGLVAGSESGLVVLDVDPRHGGDDLLAEQERRHGQLPATISVVSGGGGAHYYFRAAGPVSGRSFSNGLSVLAEGGLVVAPPSLHASGRRYEWDNVPGEVDLADLPQWLASTKRRARRSLATADIPKGTRNVLLTQIAGRLRLFLPYPEARLSALRAVNETYCRPPLSDGEVRQIARGATGWHGLPWLASPREFFDDERLSVRAHLVLRVLCEYADASGSAWPSYSTLSRRTGIKSQTTISKTLDELEQAGRIRRKRRFNDSNVYVISRSLPRPADAGEPDPLVLSLQSVEDAVAERRVQA